MVGENVMAVGGSENVPAPGAITIVPITASGLKLASVRNTPTLDPVVVGQCVNRSNEMLAVPPGWITDGLSVPPVKRKSGNLTVPITDDADTTAGKPRPVVPRIYQVCGWQAAAML